MSVGFARACLYGVCGVDGRCCSGRGEARAFCWCMRPGNVSVESWSGLADVWMGPPYNVDSLTVFSSAIHRCIFPSPHRVYFSDVVFADIFTSFAKVLGDVWLSIFMLLPGGSLLAPPVQEGLARWILPTIMR